jgi:predicted O-methyltransferase YrrM
MNPIKALLPRRLKQSIKQAQQERAMREALREARSMNGAPPSSALLEKFSAAWGDDGFHAAGGYLEDVISHARQTTGPILELGSGLTTLLLAVYAPQRTWTFEHLPEFHNQTKQVLAKYDLDHSQILLAPLHDFGDFEWYLPPRSLPPFQLVIADGPPGGTKGGRYGLLPRMMGSFTSDAVILLDDTQRKPELDILEHWNSEFGLSYSLQHDNERSWARCYFS